MKLRKIMVILVEWVLRLLKPKESKGKSNPQSKSEVTFYYPIEAEEHFNNSNNVTEFINKIR